MADGTESVSLSFSSLSNLSTTIAAAVSSVWSSRIISNASSSNVAAVALAVGIGASSVASSVVATTAAVSFCPRTATAGISPSLWPSPLTANRQGLDRLLFAKAWQRLDDSDIAVDLTREFLDNVALGLERENEFVE
eukprot:CAMPEP_0168829648 /NCGR_PEP_ID=MMETSP0727-20121128/1127_1 /TAXON_ID=265536 /ORGANISM="Amphiprora sp., Strain CCMP467" /LENGTH=136 /DNA_ID=CAMNT_0008882861 /DNA_START=111 /DNA_END=518 /DNA_ORIENTATION=+